MAVTNASGQTVYLPEDLRNGNVAIVPDSGGWAKPNPEGDIVATKDPVPEDDQIPAPWGPHNALAGSHHHQCVSTSSYKGDNVPDQYANDEFTYDFVVLHDLEEGDDPRGDLIISYWRDKGHEVQVVLAQKTAPIRVLGVAAQNGHFATSESKLDKPTEFNAGHIFAGNVKGTRFWVIDAAEIEQDSGGLVAKAGQFTTLYEDGRINPGDPPTKG